MSNQLSPEQRCQSLIKEYKNILPRMDYAVLDTTAKQCAIICVQNLIAEHTFKYPISWNVRKKAYWESVLKELEKL